MATPRFTTNLFYSYSHKDSMHRDRMETSLRLLRDLGLNEWSDKCIYPGDTIGDQIRSRMEDCDIFVFLVSPEFLASDPCRAEWEYARQLSRSRQSVVLVPVILAPCAWPDFQDMSELKALPDDARPITSFKDPDAAWLQVYDGLKSVIQRLRHSFELREDVREEMERTEFIGRELVRLEEIFVFPKLSAHPDTTEDFRKGKTFECVNDIVREQHVIVYGDRLSGKSALCRYIFLELVSQNKPVLYIDLATIRRSKNTKSIVAAEYYRQFRGDLEVWLEQSDTAVILDNLSDDAKVTEHVLGMIEIFETVIICSDTHTLQAYFKDDRRFVQFTQIEVCPLTQAKQEELIRNRLGVSDPRNQGSDTVEGLPDGYVDSVEARVNSVILSNRILPRYPFYVLSILQTYEICTPSDLTITSYGHCYYVLILAHLGKSGIASDDEVGACLNFCEQLAFQIHKSNSFGTGIGQDQFTLFVTEYRKKFIIKDSTLSRLLGTAYGIISKDRGHFRYPSIYYYFLGQYFAQNLETHRADIRMIVKRSYTTYNSLALIFTIHHTNDHSLIEDILEHTKGALHYVEPATLDHRETTAFESMVDQIPHDILSSQSVGSERRKERDQRDKQEMQIDQSSNRSNSAIGDASELTELMNDMYRITKNNEILGQILHNKYGSIERGRIAEIVSVIIQGGLRLIRILICNESELQQLAEYLHSKHPEDNIDKLKGVVGLISFIWIIHNLSQIAGRLNKPEIAEVVDDVLAGCDQPAYDLIRYFLRLDIIDTYSDSERRDLRKLWKKHKDRIIRRLISLRTQRYLNTHRIDTAIEQGVCKELEVIYRPRMKEADVISSDRRGKKKKYTFKGKKRSMSRRPKKRK